MTLTDTIDRLGDLLGEPRAPRLEYVCVCVMQFNSATLAESERVIRENPELAREMGVEVNT